MLFSQRHYLVTDHFTEPLNPASLLCHVALGSLYTRLVKNAVIFSANLACPPTKHGKCKFASTRVERGEVRCIGTPTSSFHPSRARKC